MDWERLLFSFQNETIFMSEEKIGKVCLINLNFQIYWKPLIINFGKSDLKKFK
jgi:hypothetical protein